MSTPGAANGTGAHATTAADLPYGGDVQAAAKAQDREAIRTIMAWRCRFLTARRSQDGRVVAEK